MAYLPKLATPDEACAWLAERTGEAWTLARLLEQNLMPWLWVDYSPGLPVAIFGKRREGYLAPMLFAGDRQRLTVDRGDALVTITKTHDGQLLKIDPGMRAPLSELRFKREDIMQVVAEQEDSQPAPATPAKAHRQQENEILEVLRGLGYDPKALPRNPPGSPGAKARARAQLTFTSKVFDKAWERLRQFGDIADAP